MNKKILNYGMILIISFINSISYSETITNSYTSNLVKVFESSFEDYEGNGGFVDSSVHNDGDLTNDNRYKWRHREASWGSPGVEYGEKYWGTAIYPDGDSRVWDNTNYNLYSPWFSGKKHKVHTAVLVHMKN